MNSISIIIIYSNYLSPTKSRNTIHCYYLITLYPIPGWLLFNHFVEVLLFRTLVIIIYSFGYDDCAYLLHVCTLYPNSCFLGKYACHRPPRLTIIYYYHCIIVITLFLLACIVIIANFRNSIYLLFYLSRTLVDFSVIPSLGYLYVYYIYALDQIGKIIRGRTSPVVLFL